MTAVINMTLNIARLFGNHVEEQSSPRLMDSPLEKNDERSCFLQLSMHEIRSQVVTGDAFITPGVNSYVFQLSTYNQITQDRG